MPPSLLRLSRALFLAGGLAFLALLGVYFIQRDALKYATFTPEVYQRFWDDRWSLATHVLTGGIALLVAPLQFIRGIRRRWPRVHRAIGWLYVGGSLISAPFVLRLAVVTECASCRTPFLIWAVVWISATTLAIAMALRLDFEAHRQFMTRSYVLLLGFVFIRLETHLELPIPLMPTDNRSSVVIWISWVVPLVLTEMWLSWSPLVARRRAGRVRREPVES